MSLQLGTEQGVRYVKFAIDNPWLYSLLIDDEEEDWSAMTEDERALAMRADGWVVKALKDGIEQGKLRSDLDIRTAPLMMWAALHGIASLMLRGRVSERHPQFPIESASDLIDRYVRSILRGFEP